MAYDTSQYSDPFAKGHNDIKSGATYSDIDAVSYYSPSMFTTKTDGDLVLTHQDEHVQRRQSHSDRSTHSKKFSMDRTGSAAGGNAAGGGATGAAAEFYKSEPQDLSASAGGIHSSRLSQLTEEDEDEFSQKYANPSYGAGLDGSTKVRPYDTHDETLDASLMKNAVGTERPGFSDLGEL